MNEAQLNRLMQDEKLIDEKIKLFEKEGVIVKKEDEEELKGHIEKAKHNLEFIGKIPDNFNDWCVVACYYSVYHIALAMAMNKGYFSKSHDATLCLLIKYYHEKELTEEEIKILNEAYLDNQDVLFYAQTRQERQKASYSTNLFFEKNSVNQLKLRTRLFVNKWKEILQEGLGNKDVK